MEKDYSVGSGGQDSLATMIIGDYDSSGNISDGVSLVLGNLKEYKCDQDKAIQVNYACGSTKPISINKGIVKTEGSMTFNMLIS